MPITKGIVSILRQSNLSGVDGLSILLERMSNAEIMETISSNARSAEEMCELSISQYNLIQDARIEAAIKEEGLL